MFEGFKLLEKRLHMKLTASGIGSGAQDIDPVQQTSIAVGAFWLLSAEGKQAKPGVFRVAQRQRSL